MLGAAYEPQADSASCRCGAIEDAAELGRDDADVRAGGEKRRELRGRDRTSTDEHDAAPGEVHE